MNMASLSYEKQSKEIDFWAHSQFTAVPYQN